MICENSMNLENAIVSQFQKTTHVNPCTWHIKHYMNAGMVTLIFAGAAIIASTPIRWTKSAT